jgi:hypothetical protein
MRASVHSWCLCVLCLAQWLPRACARERLRACAHAQVRSRGEASGRASSRVSSRQPGADPPWGWQRPLPTCAPYTVWHPVPRPAPPSGRRRPTRRRLGGPRRSGDRPQPLPLRSSSMGPFSSSRSGPGRASRESCCRYPRLQQQPLSSSRWDPGRGSRARCCTPAS